MRRVPRIRGRWTWRAPHAIPAVGDGAPVRAGKARRVRRGRRGARASPWSLHGVAPLDTAARAGHQQRIEQAETEIDNLRAAFGWSRENSDIALALQLASSLQPLWVGRGRVWEGLAWFDAVLTDENAQQLQGARAVRARALADRAMLAASVAAHDSMDQAEEALAIARELDDPALLVRALTACGSSAAFNTELARPYLAEAIDLARTLGDRWRLSRILAWQASAAIMAGDPVAARAAAKEGRDLADVIGDPFVSRQCRWCLGQAQMWQGDLAEADAQLRELVAEADAAADVVARAAGLVCQGHVLAYQGDTSAARAAAIAAIDAGAELGGLIEGFGYLALTYAALAAGDVAAAADASEAAWRRLGVQREFAAMSISPKADVALARGDVVAARRLADDAVSGSTG